MIRKIIKIDREKCNGCGLCAEACEENAIGMVNGKAELLRDDYCDGLGNCLPVCPVNAISFEEREALPFNEEEVKKQNEKKETLLCGCSTHSIKQHKCDDEKENTFIQFPVQIKLVPAKAQFYENANLLIAADCTAFTYNPSANNKNASGGETFREKFIKNHIVLVGCPKLDMVDYTQKLTEIIKNNNIKSVKIVRMEVPCCSGIERAAKEALKNSGKFIPWQIIVISTDGRILD